MLAPLLVLSELYQKALRLHSGTGHPGNENLHLFQPEWHSLRDSAQEAAAAATRKMFDCWRTQRRNWWDDTGG